MKVTIVVQRDEGVNVRELRIMLEVALQNYRVMGADHATESLTMKERLRLAELVQKNLEIILDK